MNIEQNSGLRVVLDTNVFISIFSHSHSVLFPIWQHAIHRHYVLLISPAIIREIAAVLRRKFRWEEPRILVHLKLITHVGELVTPRVTIEAVSNDPADNRILECAIAGDATLIVSGDRHLLRLGNYEGIPIVRPIDFLRTIGT
jgi:uncharacterized protein